jgi:NAD+ kinase
MEHVVARLTAGDYAVHERMTISATVDAGKAVGVNDVVVEKIDSQRLVVLDVAIDGEDFVTYRADGVIVATPTGSTAYSFSAGGPLVTPEVDALILTPVAAHSLFDQSLVLAPGSKIRITVMSDRPVKVSVDKNDLGRLTNGGVVSVAAGEEAARFVSLEGISFSRLIKSKFELH